MQPNNVLYEYLTDLITEPDDQQVSQPSFGDIKSEQSVPAESDCRQRLNVDPTTGRTLTDEQPAPNRHSTVAAVSPGIPDWAAEPFQVLMFRLHGVNLGVPLHYLDSIARWNGRSTSIPGQSWWQIGLFLHNRKLISLIDLSRLIMPERITSSTKTAAGYLLLVGGARWGLTCDSIQRPKLVRAGDVRWSRNRQTRRWSHGIMIENLSVLLNVDALLEIVGTNDA